MVDEHREPTREPHHTTVVQTDRGGSGAGTVIAVVLAILLIGLLLLLAFGGWLSGAGSDVDIPEEVGVNIDVDQPDMQTPDVQPPEGDAPSLEQDGASE